MKYTLSLIALVAVAGCSREAPAVPAPPSAPSTGLHLPAFTLRTMDHRNARVELDGEKLTAPCLWSITSSFKGTEKLGSAWPPEGAKYGGKSVHPEHPASFAEVYVVPEVPGLRAGECLLAVAGVVDGTSLRGAVRLYVEGYRFTVYTPLDLPAGEDASKFHRTLWFERISDE